jgi:hypothetical protein
LGIRVSRSKSIRQTSSKVALKTNKFAKKSRFMAIKIRIVEFRTNILFIFEYLVQYLSMGEILLRTN